MNPPDTTMIDGRTYSWSWRWLCEIRRRQLDAWKAARPQQLPCSILRTTAARLGNTTRRRACWPGFRCTVPVLVPPSHTSREKKTGRCHAPVAIRFCHSKATGGPRLPRRAGCGGARCLPVLSRLNSRKHSRFAPMFRSPLYFQPVMQGRYKSEL